MVIGYLEDGTVRVYSNRDAAMREWGQYPTDLLSDVIILYDDDGTWLEPVARYLPKTWYRWWSKLGGVDLIRSTKKGGQDPLAYLLHYEATRLEDNHVISSLEQLKARFPWDAQRNDSIT